MTVGHPSQAVSWEWWEGDEDELHVHRITAEDISDVWNSGPNLHETSVGEPVIGR